MALTKVEKLSELLQTAIDSHQAGHLDRAIELLSDRADEFPRSAKLWGYLGFLYSENGDSKQAIRAFRKTAGLSPHSEQASLGLFHSLWRAHKTDDAFDEMRRFVKRNDSPRYRELLRNMLAEPGDRRIEPGHPVNERKVGRLSLPPASECDNARLTRSPVKASIPSAPFPLAPFD
jgi:tetratricopeptide (TPR) repeat protein